MMALIESGQATMTVQPYEIGSGAKVVMDS